MSSDIIKWDEDDPRDVTSRFHGYDLRVKAQKFGTEWRATVSGSGFSYESVHVSKDAAKQKAAKAVREQITKGAGAPARA